MMNNDPQEDVNEEVIKRIKKEVLYEPGSKPITLHKTRSKRRKKKKIVRKIVEVSEDSKKKYSIDQNIIHEKGYPVKSVEPKVCVPHKDPPNGIPRRIVIERKRRKHNSKNIMSILKKMGIDWTSPSKVTKNRFEHYLPLDSFDNAEFDSRTPQEWIDLGKVIDEFGREKMYFVPAKTIIFSPEGIGTWVPCKVLDVDVNENKYMIDLNSQKQWKPRIYILFNAEDPENHAKRIFHAFESRKNAESMIRYNLYVDNMPNDEIPPLDKVKISHMRGLALSTKKLKENKEKLSVRKLLKEINSSYERTMNKIIFDKNMSDESQKELFSFLRLPPEKKKKKAPWCGVVKLPKYNYKKNFQNFQFNTFLSDVCVIETLLQIKKENLEKEEMRILNLPLKKITHIDDFKTLQNQSIEKHVHHLEEIWKNNTVKIITNNFRNVKKGWLNIFEKKVSIYNMSKLKRFMNTVRFMMEDTLRFFVEDSLKQFVEFLYDLNRFDVTVKSPRRIECVDKTGKKENRGQTFSVELIHKDGNFCYKSSIDNYEIIMTELFDKVVDGVQNISNVEPYVMKNLYWNWNEIKKLKSIKLVEAFTHVLEWRKAAITQISEAVSPLREYLALFSKYDDLLKNDNVKYAKEFEKQEKSLEEIKKEIRKHLKQEKDVEREVPTKIVVGSFLIDCSKVRKYLSKKCSNQAELILEILNKQGKTKVSSIISRFSKLQRELNRPAPNIQILTKVREFMKILPEKIEVLSKEIVEMRAVYDLLELFKFKVSDEEFKQKCSAMGWPKKLFESKDRIEVNLIKLEEEFRERMEANKGKFKTKLDRIDAEVAEFSKRVKFAKVKENAKDIKQIMNEVKKCQQEADEFRDKEILFNVEVSQYSQLNQIISNIQPFADLWLTAYDWIIWQESWMNDPFEKLDSKKMEDDIKNSDKKIARCIMNFKQNKQILEIANEISERIKAFKPKLPLVIALLNPGIKSRHWGIISKEVEEDLVLGESIKTLADILDFGLNDHLEAIQKIADIASKEFTIENALKDMKGIWNNTKFDLLKYKKTETFVLKITDEFIQQLDDHIAQTQTISFSSFKGEFEKEIDDWDEKLNLISEIVDEWMNCQREWMALEPIFSSPELIKQLPHLYKQFNLVDQKYRKLMSDADSNPSVLQFCSSTKILDIFKQNNGILSTIQKGLFNYLETKRKQFARLYFLADDELLTILAKAKEPRTVQPYLKKCFTNINKVTFENNDDISWMHSKDGEKVKFLKPIQPLGSVEVWLKRVEYQMMVSVKDELQKSLVDYSKGDRNDWVMKWPGQIIIVGSQIFWTKEVTEVLNTKGNKGLKEYHEKMYKQITEVSSILGKDVTPLERLKLSSLLTIEVHGRDVVERMYKEGANSVNDFQWISQLRYYWEKRDIQENMIQPNFTVDEKKEENYDCVVRQVEAEFVYGCEYLGNTTRLVITPLTDRIYLTLTGALKMVLGGSPAGPAGTGKTETVKDLAKAVAKNCVVFNCSEGLNEFAMGKFFKGLCMGGAWACFDEFNRIDIEVLSVIAQQITTLQDAIRAGIKECEFEETTVTVDPTFAVFITMNPGYAGRTELPDNLKALFRPVACMIPDYALIAEIRLFSFGFSNAKSLSKKMVATFKLSSEQLSSQDHYDFGMRALNTVIASAGLLKRNDPSMNEDLLLLKALLDSNMPKFLDNDVILFDGIVGDLFPNVEVKKGGNEVFLEQLKKSSLKLGFDPNQNFINKCVQLHETMNLRHGLMIVGLTGCGKSSSYVVLDHTITELSKVKPKEYKPVKKTIINPKSLTMSQLYGEYDKNTREWKDGVLANEFKKFSEDETDTLKWLIFDGPVDALWIESMNTVLDDNKKLCLVSGAIIELSRQMNVVFEVENLAVASPATVSRCGMVYLNQSTVPLESLMKSWAMDLVVRFPIMKNHVEKLEKFASIVLKEALEFFEKQKDIFLYVPLIPVNMITSFFKLFECLIQPYSLSQEELFLKSEHEREQYDEKLATLKDNMEPFIFFSIMWSLGATCDLDGRKKLDIFFRKQFMLLNIKDFPKEGLIFDYQYEQDKKEWVHWTKTVDEYELNPRDKFKDIVIPTIDTIRYSWLIKTFLNNGKNTLCIGPTGTGKSMVISDVILNLGKKKNPIFVYFSARTSANQTQDIIDSKTVKRRKGVFGPSPGSQNIIFVDDMNMPQKEKYGAQPPIELLRQWMDHGGWYEYKSEKLAFRKIIDTTFIAGMGPTGGGRKKVTNRFLRHFNVLSFPEMEDATIYTIFHTILNGWVKVNIIEKLHFVSEDLVNSSIDLYNSVRKQMLPTPTKSHYTFNLRDIAKVFQGILDVNTSTVTKITDFIKLWVHECRRVFKDRLVNDEDRNKFESMINKKISETFKVDYTDVVDESKRLLYGDYMSGGVEKKSYEEVASMNDLVKSMDEQLEYYNSTNDKQMNLVLFLDAIEHISRISRILRQKGGHALLLGVGGSGRRSLTKLAAFMADFKMYELNISKGFTINDWKEFLKEILRSAGLNDNEVVFLFADTDILYESFLEDINNMLNSGDVPSLYANDELEEIYTVMKKVCAIERLAMTPSSFFSRYVKRVRNNLHIVIAMSPSGEVFRNRLRMFPSLVNCCTIDWFSPWPVDALISVAKEKLGKCDSKTYQMCSFIHKSVEEESRVYFETTGRYNYVTPTSYLELLQTLSSLQKSYWKKIEDDKKKFENGLETLRKTEVEVAKLEKILQNKKPILLQTQKVIEENMKKIKKDKDEADKTKEIISKQEQEAETREKECRGIKESAEEELAVAIPALNNALKDLKNLDHKEIKEVANYSAPSEGIILTVKAICVFFDVKPIKQFSKTGQKTYNYWDPGKELLKTGQKLVNRMLNYNRDNISPKKISQIEKFIKNENFKPEIIKKASSAATAMCQFVRAMYNYYDCSKKVEPKRQKLAAAKAELAVVVNQLNEARSRLNKIVDKIKKLNEDNAKSVRKQKELSDEVEQCNIKLVRAEKLIDGLANEKERWIATLEKLKIKKENVNGDILVCSGSIAYTGSFTKPFRNSLKKKWIDELKRISVSVSSNIDVSTLVEPMTIRQWTQEGLPSDELSIENAIIFSRSRRWPLFIDPQLQAKKWIKKREKSKQLRVINMNEKDYMRTLLSCVQFGHPVLLEDIGETLHPELDPILMKQTIPKNGILHIRIGEDEIPYNNTFRLYLTTKLRNPHYSPELSAKVTMLNFFITPQGLDDQLLGTVVSLEKAELEQMMVKLMIKNANLSKQLVDIQNNILKLLDENKGDVLGSEGLIFALGKSKIASNEIKTQLDESEQTKQKIEETRNKYRPVAQRSSLLFFCLSDMANVDPMYQNSLHWFINLFKFSIENAEKNEDINKRVKNLVDYFTFLLYTNVCQSLFEKHKLLFSFVLTTRIMSERGDMDNEEWRYLLTGTTASPMTKTSPSNAEWITEKMWSEIINLSSLSFFGKEFFDSFLEKSKLKRWEEYFKSEDIISLESPFKEKEISEFQRILILRALRPDKVSEKIIDFVTKTMGKKFVEPPRFDLMRSFKASNSCTPLVFILSPGADPKTELNKFAKIMRVKKFDAISLGRGTEKKAISVIEEGKASGNWVLLQNCHLTASFMPQLEQVISQFDPEDNNRDFRLWLTSMPSKNFPISILQNSVKMTLEPPKGLKANMMRSFDNLNDGLLKHGKKPEEFKKLMFSLCFFHAVIQERRKFGPLGWNVEYEFTKGDLDICTRQLRMFLEKYENVPYKILKFLCGEINYGGRLTDMWDRRTIKYLITDYLNPNVLMDGYEFTSLKEYTTISQTDHAGYIKYLESLPNLSVPEVVGLHRNGEINYNTSSMNTLMNTIISMVPKGSRGGGGNNEIIISMAGDILKKVSKPFDVNEVKSKFPTKREESMNTVIVQEVLRYNRLLSVVRKTLGDLMNACKGVIVMSQDLEKLEYSLLNNIVPEKWEQFAYPSEMYLKDWVLNLETRCRFISNWIEKGVAPKAFWISGFFFPQGFLTGILQNYSRKHSVAIDRVSFEYVVTDKMNPMMIKKEDSDDDCVFVYGLFMEGARFNKFTKKIDESNPKVLFEKMPVIKLKPVLDRKPVKEGIYSCPLYKTLSRRGTLSTTGHSTNFVVAMDLPSDRDESHWVKRGVALVCSLKYYVNVDLI